MSDSILLTASYILVATLVLGAALVPTIATMRARKNRMIKPQL